MSPTALTLRTLRERGYVAEVVEKWISHLGIRKDFFGWIDILVVRPDTAGVLGVQTTTGSHVSERIMKAKGNRALFAWIGAGNHLAISSAGRRESAGWRMGTGANAKLENCGSTPST